MIGPIIWLWNIRHRDLIERTKRMVYALILIQETKKKRCRVSL